MSGLLAGFPVFIFPAFFGDMPSVARKYSVYRNRFGQLLGSCVCLCIFPLVLGIHLSNEVREALEKTNKDEFGRYNLGKTFFGCEPHKLNEMDQKKCEGLLTEKECLETHTSTLWGRVHHFFVSIYLIPASPVLDIYECLSFRGKKDYILVSHCLLLARYYIYCCKFKNMSPSIREYAQQLKCNLEIEKQISIVTD